MTEEKHHEHEAHHHEHKEKHHEHKEHHHTEHKKSDGLMVKKSNVWQMATALAVLLLIFSIVTGGFGVNKGAGVKEVISEEEAAQKAMDYINNNLLQPGTTATLKEVSKSGSGVYNIDITVAGRDYDSYVTQDGKLLFINGVDMTVEVETPETTTPETPEMTKSDKPEVELFIMSHCPYGTQAEKGIIPAVKALGDDIDFNVRFVYYAMHGEKEVTEQTKQYCIQKEQNDKFLDYLVCFLKDGESEPCLTEAKIDTGKMDVCIEAADKEFEITDNLEDNSKWLNGRFPKFNTDADLNSKYGVGGSPTLVINGASASSSRDSASYLKTICASFNEAPESCDTELSSASPSAGFGYSETAATATEAQCG